MLRKKTKRNKKKYPALDKSVNLKTRQELIDFSYFNKLNDKEKEWLNSFVEEYIHANFNHKGKVLYNSKDLKKSCYAMNNARNRDQYTLAKSVGLIDTLEVVDNHYLNKIEEDKD